MQVIRTKEELLCLRISILSLAVLFHIYWKTSFEKTGLFSAWASRLNMGLINNKWYGMFFACEIWAYS